MQRQREYKGFDITAESARARLGGYVGSVTLKRQGATQRERKFDVPLDKELASEHEALRLAMQFGVDLIDGVVPWFDPKRMC